MYDGQPQPERNDPCWCGSGKKYKKCHLSIDNQLQHFYDEGLEVPSRAMLKNAGDIEAVRKSAAVNIGVLDYVAERIGPGVTTAQINDWVNEYTEAHGGIPADLDFEGYPFSVCTSINEVVCHGMPSEDDVLKEGDIVNVDCSTIVDGYFSDSSRMFCIGEVSEERKRLVEVTHEAMLKGLEQVKPWGRLGDVGAAVKAHAEANGFSVVREFGGHGRGSRTRHDVHDRTDDKRRRIAHRHERSQRLDRAYCRRKRFCAVGNPGRRHRRRLRTPLLVKVTNYPVVRHLQVLFACGGFAITRRYEGWSCRGQQRS